MPPIIVDGKPHRMRRGKLVAIPPEWLGRITTRKTIRDRKKASAEKRMSASHRALALRNAPTPTEWD